MKQLNLTTNAPAQFKGEPLPDATKVTQRLVTERTLQSKKTGTLQLSMMTEAKQQPELF